MDKAAKIFEKLKGLVRADKEVVEAIKMAPKAAPSNSNRFAKHLDDSHDAKKATEKMLSRTVDDAKRSIIQKEVEKVTLKHERRKKIPGMANRSEEKYLDDLQDIERSALKEVESKARNKVVNTMATLGVIGGAGAYYVNKKSKEAPRVISY